MTERSQGQKGGDDGPLRGELPLYLTHKDLVPWMEQFGVDEVQQRGDGGITVCVEIISKEAMAVVVVGTYLESACGVRTACLERVGRGGAGG